MQMRLSALDISEERALAGKIAGALYLTAALGVCAMLAVPGVPKGDWEIVVAAAAVATLWALACLVLIPWERAHSLVWHFSTLLGLPLTTAVVAATGGAGSPAAFYLFFLVVYCAYFYRAPEAVPYIAAAVLAHALPLSYEGERAVDDGLIAELIVIGPAYVVLGVLIMAGKKRLVDLREEARELSLHDSLTGLSNRRALMDTLYTHVGGQRAGDTTGLLLVDLDDFKDANTLYGLPGGDQVLRETGRALRRAARDGDLVARLGGDEFAIVGHGLDEQGVRVLSERVLRAIRAADAKLELPEFRLRASAGWALYPKDADNVDELIAAADLSLRGAKITGKDRAVSPLDWLPD